MYADPGSFQSGGSMEMGMGAKGKLIHLIGAVRTLLRSEFFSFSSFERMHTFEG